MFSYAWNNATVSDCTICVAALPEEEEATTKDTKKRKTPASPNEDADRPSKRRKHTWTKSDMCAMKDSLQQFVSSHIATESKTSALDDATTVQASKAILGAQSGFFRDMWKSGFKEATEGHVTLYAMNDREAELIIQALKYCYTEELADELNVPDLIHMFMVADKFQMAKLMTATMVRLPKQMKTLQDACLIIDLIDTLPQITQDCKPVYIRAIECLGSHFKWMHKMWLTDDFVKLSLRAVCALFSAAGRKHLDPNFDEHMVYRAVQRWARANAPVDELVTETLQLENIWPAFYFNVIMHDATFHSLSIWDEWCRRYQMIWMQNQLPDEFIQHYDLPKTGKVHPCRKADKPPIGQEAQVWYFGYLFKLKTVDAKTAEIAVDVKESGLGVDFCCMWYINGHLYRLSDKNAVIQIPSAEMVIFGYIK